ncbi:MAG: hypothetical protein Kow0010_00680 [Dehalococcoidia bacterium]
MASRVAAVGERRMARVAWPDAVVVAMVGALALALLMRNPGPARMLYAGAGAGVLTWIALYDVRTLRAPNRVVYPAIGALLLGSTVLGLSAAASAVGGAALSFGFFLVIAMIGRGAMGFGDAKVAAVAGASVGLGGLVPMLLATHLAGMLVASVALGFRLRSRNDVVAYTPFLLLGVVAATWVAPTVGPS